MIPNRLKTHELNCEILIRNAESPSTVEQKETDFEWFVLSKITQSNMKMVSHPFLQIVHSKYFKESAHLLEVNVNYCSMLTSHPML